VPVYGLGTDATGQPYYAMQFVRGETLRAAIAAYHQGGGDPGPRRLAFRGLLSRVIATCNVMAYAHSRGVVHRDLKPANIMLGKYGETLVVDWGLAKVVGREKPHMAAGEETLGPPTAGTDGATQPGHT